MKDVVGDLSLLVTLDLYQHIARIEHSRRFDALITAHFDDGFLREEHFCDLSFKIHIADPSVQTFDDLVLMPRICVDEIPLLHVKNLYAPAILFTTHVRNSKIYVHA